MILQLGQRFPRKGRGRPEETSGRRSLRLTARVRLRVLNSIFEEQGLRDHLARAARETARWVRSLGIRNPWSADTLRRDQSRRFHQLPGPIPIREVPEERMVEIEKKEMEEGDSTGLFLPTEDHSPQRTEKTEDLEAPKDLTDEELLEWERKRRGLREEG